ncbi:MAG TPA: DUF6569 family protein, partial [Pyrinomonadaceae bacterium]|nr:DUF6569 family protein [Pyrinomonadaceae bacterium]
TVVITERGGERRMVRRRGGRRGARRVQVRSEESGDDSVNELALINRSGKKLLLLGGEVIVGGKQDRIVEEDLIVPAVSVPVSLSVFCVEHGRWSHRSERAVGAGGVGGGGGGGVGVGSGPVQAASETVEVVASPSVVEANVSASQSTSNEMSVSGSRSASASRPETFSSLGAISHPKLRAAAQDKKEQGEVWKEVSANNVRLNTTNTTDTYQQVYESEEVRATMDDYVAALQGELAGADVVGVVVARGGELIWVDQFASPSLFRRYWPKLLKSYVVEAISGPTEERKPGVEEAQRYLDERSGDAKATVKPGVYELTKLENPRYAVFDLWDISKAARVRLHYNKMQR